MICPAPTLRTPSYARDHTIIRSVCAGHDFPKHDDEGVSLWFSGQRLLTDRTSENSVKAKFTVIAHRPNSPSPEGLTQGAIMHQRGIIVSYV
jgi:hypothetical protein